MTQATVETVHTYRVQKIDGYKITDTTSAICKNKKATGIERIANLWIKTHDDAYSDIKPEKIAHLESNIITPQNRKHTEHEEL